jgi:predicted transcriptional regulator
VNVDPEEPIVLTPAQMEMIREGLRDLEEGRVVTWDEVMVSARAKLREWLPDQSQSA